MADMELMIKISEEDYEYIKERGFSYSDERNRIAEAIANGTPLPKRHGDLVDRDAIQKAYDYSDMDYSMIDALNDAQAIIEAESEDEK